MTVAVATLLEPPAPLQVNEYDVVAASGPVLWLPLAALLPFQPPEAMHEVALVEIQVSVEAPPLGDGGWIRRQRDRWGGHNGQR